MVRRDAACLAIDSTHSRAICDEIGERLRDALGREVSDIPSYLCQLVDRLAELERVPAPSIVPSIDDASAGILDNAVRQTESALALTFTQAMKKAGMLRNVADDQGLSLPHGRPPK
jgi:hypothetical protein